MPPSHLSLICTAQLRVRAAPDLGEGSASETSTLPRGKGDQLVPSYQDFVSKAEPKG